ncbi:MAG TPA: methyl-accepting chemotaxis protein [Spirochaetota bacterium]|nr:methyl-accepting chemotaxis protein [Spirochaetota bacterium]
MSALNIETSLFKINRNVLVINWILDTLLLLGYVIEYFKGAKTLSYIITFFIVMMIPLLWATILYRLDKNDEKIKYITLFGYFILYIFTVFSATRTMVFVYILPMLSMYLLYFDLNLMKFSCIAMVIINTIRIIWLTGFMGLRDAYITTDYTIQMGCVILFAVVYISTTKLSNEINSEKLGRIHEEQDKQKSLIEDILHTAAVLIENSKKAYDIVEKLAQNTGNVSMALNEVSKETLEVTGNLQNQMKLSSHVSDSINSCLSLASEMGNESEGTVAKVTDALKVVENLTSNSEIVRNEGARVNETITGLIKQSEEIRNVINIIREISDMTNLLSLNASIEAARAGDAGRGFAVVADEISKLADQSRESAESIGGILNGMKNHVDDSLSAVNSLSAANRQQDEMIGNTESVFREMLERMNSVREKSRKVMESVTDINNNNTRIVEDIKRITSFSEKTASVTAQASAKARDNRNVALEGKEVASKLIETSADMEKYRI